MAKVGVVVHGHRYSLYIEKSLEIIYTTYIHLLNPHPPLEGLGNGSSI